MPILGQIPIVNNQIVILTNGTEYQQTTLVDMTPEYATLYKPASCQQGLYRVFPLFPEQDGLFELQGEIFETTGKTVRLTF